MCLYSLVTEFMAELSTSCACILCNFEVIAIQSKIFRKNQNVIFTFKLKSFYFYKFKNYLAKTETRTYNKSVL